MDSIRVPSVEAVPFNSAEELLVGVLAEHAIVLLHQIGLFLYDVLGFLISLFRATGFRQIG